MKKLRVRGEANFLPQSQRLMKVEESLNLHLLAASLGLFLGSVRPPGRTLPSPRHRTRTVDLGPSGAGIGLFSVGVADTAWVRDQQEMACRRGGSQAGLALMDSPGGRCGSPASSKPACVNSAKPSFTPYCHY